MAEVYRENESWKTGSSQKRENMAVYVEWLLTPVAERDPSTKTELAELLGVTPQTLRNYAREPWLQRELIDRGRTLNRVERASDVLDALYSQATHPQRPSVPAAKVWLDWTHTQLEALPPADLTDMSNEQLMTLVLETMKRMDEPAEVS